MPWRRGKNITHKTKYDLAVEMLEWAINKGFPKCTVLADSWFGIAPFIKELKRLELSYILETKSNYKVKTNAKEPKLTPTGLLAKNQYDETPLPQYFKKVLSIKICGFSADKETGKREKVLYNVKVATVILKSIPGRHRIVESVDPVKQSTKYLLTNLPGKAQKSFQLTVTDGQLKNFLEMQSNFQIWRELLSGANKA